MKDLGTVFPYTNIKVVVNKKRGLEDIMVAVGVDLTDFVSL